MSTKIRIRKQKNKIWHPWVLIISILVIIISGITGVLVRKPLLAVTADSYQKMVVVVHTQIPETPAITRTITPTIIKTVPEPTPTPIHKTIVITRSSPRLTVITNVENGKLNVRSGAGVDFPVVGVVYEGDKVQVVTDCQNERWVGILSESDTIGSIIGFVYARYLSDNNPCGRVDE